MSGVLGFLTMPAATPTVSGALEILEVVGVSDCVEEILAAITVEEDGCCRDNNGDEDCLDVTLIVCFKTGAMMKPGLDFAVGGCSLTREFLICCFVLASCMATLA